MTCHGTCITLSLHSRSSTRIFRINDVTACGPFLRKVVSVEPFGRCESRTSSWYATSSHIFILIRRGSICAQKVVYRFYKTGQTSTIWRNGHDAAMRFCFYWVQREETCLDSTWYNHPLTTRACTFFILSSPLEQIRVLFKWHCRCSWKVCESSHLQCRYSLEHFISSLNIEDHESRRRRRVWGTQYLTSWIMCMYTFKRRLLTSIMQYPKIAQESSHNQMSAKWNKLSYQHWWLESCAEILRIMCLAIDTNCTSNIVHNTENKLNSNDPRSQVDEKSTHTNPFFIVTSIISPGEGSADRKVPNALCWKMVLLWRHSQEQVSISW